ncbi:hypothetical protein AYO21_03883 [Fonsecaea monophora]|uniref:Major facilitator superfamily (MFS) profile domain-containing protein n=1 Tax=Fonsecaea monophora TaxID=254056 RepID=A0A177FE60_9EURO|nr:hypothetical protein AYO21_03883 [Fonsecaea monophora]OAG41880.1 hypothetical protein AYO21_03883 [Fonsecaea monophora]
MEKALEKVLPISPPAKVYSSPIKGARFSDTSIDDATPVEARRGKRTWKSYLWDTLDKDPVERAFLFKLDAAMLSLAGFGFFIKYLDQLNISNAFVSGMKEDLGLYGNQLNYMQTLWTVGYVLGAIPSNLLLTRVRASIYIPCIQIVWSALTMCMAACDTIKPIYALRFLIGLAESGFYPGVQYLIGCWYRRDELAKRSCIFHTSSALAGMFSGYLMAAVYHLEGRGGLRGWQWLFIVDGCIAVPVAVAGYLFYPDVPETSQAFYLSKAEIELAQTRMLLEGRSGRQPYTWTKIKKIFRSWHFYGVVIMFIIFVNNNAIPQPFFSLFLKDSQHPKYTITQINAIPSASAAVQVVTTLMYAWSSDTFLHGARWPPIIAANLVNIVIYISLAVWDVPMGWKWTCFILVGAGGGLSGLCYAWAHEICTHDNEERAFVTGSMNEFSYAVQAWLPLLVWKQVDAPRYEKGYITCAVLSAAMIVSAMVVRHLQNKELGAKRAQQGV